jgi:phenylacetate-CoA ligase
MRVNATVHGWWLPELRMAASEPVETIVGRPNVWRPEVLIAYASMARILADEQLGGRLQLKPSQMILDSSGQDLPE